MMASDKNQLGRRDFIRAATAIIGGFIGTVTAAPAIVYMIAPALRESEDDAWIDLGALADYPLNAPRLFEFTRTKVNGWERTGIGYGVFVVRQDDKRARVFSNICTHLGCHVSWHPDVGHYISPCHDGHFDVLGENISGPPPRPLDEFATKIEDGNLFIRLPPFRHPS